MLLKFRIKIEKIILTNRDVRDIVYKLSAGVAQLVEQLICNQQVGGSSPSTSSTLNYMGKQFNMGVFPSGQRGQTVNLLSSTSVVRIHPLPPKQKSTTERLVLFCFVVERVR